MDIKSFISFLFVFTSFVAQSQDTIFYYPSGKIASKGKLLNQIPEGYWVNFYEQGKIKSAGYKSSGFNDSLWIFFNDNGTVNSKINYRKGKKAGFLLMYDDSGRIKSKENYDENVLHGKQFYYFENGITERVENYELGKKSGKHVFYNQEGELQQISTYSNNQLTEQIKVNRKDQYNKKQGVWVDIDTNITIRLSGNYSNNLKNGYFRKFNAEGKLESVEYYIDDVLQNQKKDVIKPQKFRNTDKNGNVTETGILVNGKPEGKVTKFDESGRVAMIQNYQDGYLTEEGIFDENDLKTGEWKEYYISGKIKAKGNYLKGNKEGEWYFWSETENVEQKGRFLKGKPNGIWVMYHEDNTTRKEENYRSGLLDGTYVEYDRNGNVIAKGEFNEGEKDGEWLVVQGEITMKGQYQIGLKIGEWNYFYKNSKLAYQGTYVSGQAEGKHVFYFDDGRKWFEGKYRNGKKEGTWYYFPKDAENNEKLDIYYQDGIEISYDGTLIKPPFEPEDFENIREVYAD